MTTNVPDIAFSSTGLVLPAESAILSGVQKDIDGAFGGGVNPALETPQGQLASSMAAIIGAKNDAIAQYVNQVDPAFADGRMQDAIGRIYFIDRKPATATIVTATCVGLVGTVITLGAMAKATDGTIYLCTQAGTIPIGGSINLTFTAQKTGPIACPAGSLNQIYKAIPGWDTITNAADGAPGRDVESRADFEYRRKNSVAINGKNSLQSIYASVFNLDNVQDVYATENYTGSPVTRGGVTLAANSLYVAVVGGAAADIAQAIWNHKPPGSNYNGSTSVSVVDTSGYSVPYPTYTVSFTIPTALPILFAVSIANDTNLPADIVTQVKNAIIKAFYGGDGGPRARIGSTLFASRFYAPVVSLSPYVSVLSLLLGTSTPTLASLTTNIDKQPTISAANISVTLV